MKALNVKNMRKAKQQGFTIIELVVVILLLGILTATALPRFMDVTDEAHDAVVDAVRGGLLTSAALFRAQYVGKGEPLGVALADFGDDTLFPDGNGTGYPADATDGELNDETECLAVYNGLLQVGRPLAAAAAHSDTAATLEDNIEAAAGPTIDFVVTGNDEDDPLDGCVLYYVGQFKSGNTTASQIIPNLVYTLASGAVVDGTPLTLNLAD
jgi:prepilin-type N-terminal cleavage/methylation domain-containing protein